MKTKINNYLNAVERLQEAVAEYQQSNHNTLMRDGLIQRFEFTFELSWKALKEYLYDQGCGTGLNFPKQVLKTAYENEIIQDETIWLSMLEARNRTSHIYDDTSAQRIAEDICFRFLFPLLSLAEYFTTQ